MAIVSESDLSSNCCASDCDCDCQSSNNVEFEEYEVLSSSYSSCNEYHFSFSDSSTTLDDIEVKLNLIFMLYFLNKQINKY